jgi:hypothetical protein
MASMCKVSRERGAIIMIEGMLFIEEDGQLSLTVLGRLPRRHITIEPESSLEIHLGNVWIEGKYAPDYDNKGQVETLLFECENQTFCQLRSGMHGRINKEQSS